MARGYKDFIKAAKKKGSDKKASIVSGDPLLRKLDNETKRVYQRKLDECDR